MPERYVDLHLECSCPDWLKPCKHLVATWLKFAPDFERDPLLLFQLRGMDRQQLYDSLGGRAAAVPEPETEQERAAVERAYRSPRELDTDHEDFRRELGL